jgi:molybdopterin converting factor small subunit
MATMRVKLFGFLAQLSDQAEFVFNIRDGASLADLIRLVAQRSGPDFRQALLDRHGNLQGGLELILNQQHISARKISETILREDGDLAIMPLVGGG